MGGGDGGNTGRNLILPSLGASTFLPLCNCRKAWSLQISDVSLPCSLAISAVPNDTDLAIEILTSQQEELPGVLSSCALALGVNTAPTQDALLRGVGGVP